MKYIGTENNGIQYGYDIDGDGIEDFKIGFYFNKTGKYGAVIGVIVTVIGILAKIYLV